MFEVFAVGDSRAHKVVLNSLRQPGVVTRTRKAYKLWAILKGPEWFYRLGSVLRKKRYIVRGIVRPKTKTKKGCHLQMHLVSALPSVPLQRNHPARLPSKTLAPSVNWPSC
jgi:hypothetical protein